MATTTTSVRSERKQRIFEAAAKLFRDKGYNATSMRDMAESVGLEPSSLYSHIKSKEEILIQICFECGQRFLDGIHEIHHAQINAEEKLRKLIYLHVKIAQDDITSMTVFNDEWRHITEPELSQFLQMRISYEDQCISIIEEGIQTGFFKNIDTHLILISILHITQWVQRSKKLLATNTSELANQISELTLNGLLSKQN